MHAASHLNGRRLLVEVSSDNDLRTVARFGIRGIQTPAQVDHPREVQWVSGAMRAQQIVAFAT